MINVKFLLTVISWLSLLLLVPIVMATPAELAVVAQDDQSMELEFRLPSLNVKTVTGADGQTYQRFNMTGWANTEQTGAPELPVMTTLLQVPPAGEVVTEILAQEENTAPAWVVYPVPQPQITGDTGVITEQFVKDDTAYSATTFYPQAVAMVEPRVQWQTLTMARLKIYPLQWQASTKTLRYINYLRLRLHFTQPLPPLVTGSQTEPSLLRKAAPNFSFANRLILGYQPRLAAVPTLPKSNDLAPRALTTTRSTTWPQRYRVHLHTNTVGMYQVTYEELLAAGVPEDCLGGGNFKLSWQDKPVMMQVSAHRPRGFNPGDSIIFYSKAINSDYTDTNVYQLECWQLARPRPTSQATLDSPLSTIHYPLSIDGTVTGTGTLVENYRATIRLEQNQLVDDLVKGAPQQDYWFWQKLTSPDSFDTSVNLLPVDNNSAASNPGLTAFLRVNLRGISSALSTSTTPISHHTLVYFNDNLLSDYNWEGNRENLQKFPLALDLLKAGDNTIKVETKANAKGKKDQVYVNWFEVIYPRPLVADQDELQFTVTGTGRLQMRVSQLSSPELRVYDITEPARVKEVVNFTTQADTNGEGYQVQFEDTLTTSKTYYVCTTAKLRVVDKIALQSPSTLKQAARGADYLLITGQELLPAVQPLVERRQQQGLRVETVTVEDIFNEFGWGSRTPEAIKEFLQYAYEHWQAPAPRYVLLVGDSSLDYKGYLGGKKVNLLPPYLVPTVYSVAPTDNWYVSVVGDDVLPEMLIGRLPGSTVEQVTTVIDKVLSYETTKPFNHLLLVADNDESFESASEAVVKYIPTDLQLDKVYLGNYAKDEEATADLLNYLDQGISLIHYLGHGNEDLWANSTGQVLFNFDSLKKLQSTNNLTFLVVLNCLNANFASTGGYSLAESFLLVANRGAVASFAPTSVGYLWEHQLLDEALFKLLFEDQQREFGELTTQAKVDAYSSGVSEHILNTFVLIGDPAATLQLP